MPEQADLWQPLATQLRRDSLRSSTSAGSGHPTSSLSAADLLAVLGASVLRYDFDNPELATNDHLIFSKGHASPLLYAFYRAVGAVSEDELMTTYRREGSRLEGHPTPVLPWVDVATGSLGQGLPAAVGVALAGKYLDKLPYRVWVLLGDSEMAEGSIWEAFDKASYYKLDNLVAILDMNRLGQRGPTEYGWDGELYAERATAFGWDATEVNGHDPEAIYQVYQEALASEKPSLIVAKTIKGKGVSFLENKEGMHGKPVEPEKLQQALDELPLADPVELEVMKPESAPDRAHASDRPSTFSLPRYTVGDEIATREAYGEALRALGDYRKDVVGLDGEVSNSTHADLFAKAFPERFFEMFIAEQQMLGAAVGLAVRGYTPFASSFGAFWSRAYDFIRMAAVSRAKLCLCGSHAGVAIGEDGPSQMGLEDIAMMRAVHGSTVLHTCDANQTAKLVAAMADTGGISYLRTLRGKTPVIYGPEEGFPVGGSKTVRQGDDDQVTIVAMGTTVHEALAASETMAGEGVNLRVIDAYSIKPIDAQSLEAAVKETGGRLVVAEDHWPEGGLGEAVLSALATSTLALQFKHLAVREMPASATPDELIRAAGIDREAIMEAVRELLGK